jgi:purine-binding chemotaxis protein CheW
MSASSPATELRRGSGTYLVFMLGKEACALAVADVREIIGAAPITRVPGLPETVRGVINLRGKIIPVADLRIRFNIEPVDHGHRTCIIVVHARGTDFGLVVDHVVEVANIAEQQIEPPPEFGANVQPDYLLGIARSGPRVLLLLDVARTLSLQESSAMDAAVAAA